mgnify:CR=1 FL=1
MPDRNTPRRSGEFLVLTPAADTTIYAGIIGAINSNGKLVPASDSTGLKVVGRTEEYSEGEDVKVRKGVFAYDNDGSIDKSMIGDSCQVVDAITVGTTTTNNIEAGTIFDVEGNQVWVKIN